MSKIKRCLKDDKGMALITVLLILVLLTTLGMYSIWTSNSETQIGGNEKLNNMAYYVGQAGINEAIARLTQTSGPYFITNTDLASLKASGPTASGWSYNGLVNLTNGFGNYSVYIYPTWTTGPNTWNGNFHDYTTGVGYGPPSVVLYNNKYKYPASPIDGGSGGQVGFPVFHVISVGKIKNAAGAVIGISRLSADLSQNSLNFNVPGGVYGKGGLSMGGSSFVSALGDTALASGTGQDLSGDGKYETGGNQPSAMENMSSFLGMGLSQISGMATARTAGTSTPPTGLWGTATSPSILFMDNACKYSAGTPGGITFTGGTGWGIMIVTGDLTLHGNFTWNGLIYVMGNFNATGTPVINGAVMAQGTSSYSGNITVNLNRSILQQVSRAGLSNVMISWKDERQ
ncbi:MAG: PilX N-terminal domain-containing pilus assembly protein [Nitrospirota bacterium]